MRHNKLILKLFFLSAIIFYPFSSIAHSDQTELLDLSVEDLLNVEVISVAKKAKSLNDSPAAIFVISQEDIKRIGATSIPEALRLAPGIDVARIDANKWAVSSRGFNGRFSNNLLVLIDGRNTYTRAFAGVYWENQDVMLEDIERIEVIRGPGATLWGANAVNGVINIITKHSADTQGGLLVAGGGTEELGFGALRYGGELTSDTTARAYIKGFKRDENTHESGAEAGDDWDKVQGGFRVDSQISVRDTLTIQGDVYRSTINQNTTLPQTSPPYQNTFNETIDTFGGNLLLRQQHTFSSESDYSLQIFYDFYERNEAFTNESRHVVDFDFQHRFTFLNRNDLVWGTNYRYSHDHIGFGNILKLNPTSRNDQLFSAFIQNETTIIDNHLWFSVGSKFEHNDYTGFEAQPTARLMWAPHHKHRLWTAVSRAIRTPSRAEHGLNFLLSVRPPQASANPPFFTPTVALVLNGNNSYDSEEVISYELGYRTTLIDNLSIDFTAFYNKYNSLRSLEMGTPTFNGSFVEQPLFLGNEYSARTYGFEIATVWQMLDWWRWDVNYSYLKSQFNTQEIMGRPASSPQQLISLRSSTSPLKNIDLDIVFRYVDENFVMGAYGSRTINDYVSMDIRLAWRPFNDIELSLVGQNLLAEHHLEYQQEALTSATEIDRGLYGKLTWNF
ncbi:MAG: TonB-dependent receptor [Methylococcales bacterium]|nr:TonB-dependent receptor [Methylococcales bacterium]